jgi:serine/threonine-protein kinase
VGSLSFLFGPFIMVPTLALLNGILFSIQSGYRTPKGFGVLCGLSVVTPYFMELAGWLPASTTFSRDQITIAARLVDYHPVVAPVLVCLMSFGATAGPLFMLQRMRRSAEEQERRLFLHSWHLKSLLPDEDGAKT